MAFVDRTELTIASGSGGNGMVSFRTARNMPKLGPDGGNGGRGGSVVLVGTKDLNNLSFIKTKQLYNAGDGQRGGTNDRCGRSGGDMVLALPLGTVVFDKESGEKLAEIVEVGQEVVMLEGGRGGIGNSAFRSSIRRAPRISTDGVRGVRKDILCELKLLADIGIAGFPNAGKSTLLSVLSNKKPKIGAYPFTTLTPNLGTVVLEEWGLGFGSFTVADIPGLIEGASLGRGLGHKFLKHIERSKVLVWLFDGFTTSEHLLSQFALLKNELVSYNEAIIEKKWMVVINKVELLSEEERQSHIKAFSELGIEPVFISAASKQGLAMLVARLHQLL